MNDNNERLDRAEQILDSLDEQNQGLMMTTGTGPVDAKLDQLTTAIRLILTEVRAMG